MERDYSKLPFIYLSKESLETMRKRLNKEQIGNVIIAIYEHIYLGVEDDIKDASEGVAYDTAIAAIKREGGKYLNQIEAGKCGSMGAEYGKLGGRPKKNKEVGNKPKKSPKEEKGTEIPLQPLKPEFEPTDGQRIDFTNDFDDSNLEYTEEMGNFVGFTPSQQEKDDEVNKAIEWFRSKENRDIIMSYTAFGYSMNSTPIVNRYNSSGFSESSLKEAFKFCRQRYDNKRTN